MTESNLSIIMPTYERPDQLSEALAALAAQETSRIAEILIGDDSRTPEAIRANQLVIQESGLSHLVEYIHNEPQLGNYPNQVALGRRARGRYLMLLHDDDQLCESSLATMMDRVDVDEAASEGAVRAWFGRNLVMSEDGVVDEKASSESAAYYGKDGAEEVRPMWFWCLTSAMPSNSFIMYTKDYQTFCQGERDGNVGDWRMWVRMANAGYDARFIAFDAFRYRAQENAVTSTGRQVDVHFAYEGAQELVVPPEYAKAKRSMELRHADVALRRYLRDGDVHRARRLLFSTNSPAKRPRNLRVVASVAGAISPSTYRLLHRALGRTAR